MSLGFKLFIMLIAWLAGCSIPSMTISGAVLPEYDDTPRMAMSAAS